MRNCTHDKFYRNIDRAVIEKNYLQIKQDVQDIIHAEIDRILGDPAWRQLVIKKGE
jgi:hypothetical protein